MRSMPIPELYRSLHGYLLQTLPDACDSRLTNLIYLMLGLFQARSVHLNWIARKIPVRAQKLSLVRRLERFLRNPAVQVRVGYQPFIQPVLQSAANAGTIHLVMDATKVAFGYRLLMVKPRLPAAQSAGGLDVVVGQPGPQQHRHPGQTPGLCRPLTPTRLSCDVSGRL